MSDESEELVIGFIANLSESSEKSQKVELFVDNKPVQFEIDSGACKSVMHVSDYKKLLSYQRANPLNYKFKSSQAVASKFMVKFLSMYVMEVRYLIMYH